MATTPTAGISRAKTRNVGASADTISSVPNSSAAATVKRIRRLPRRAASSAPATEPIAMREFSRP